LAVDAAVLAKLPALATLAVAATDPAPVAALAALAAAADAAAAVESAAVDAASSEAAFPCEPYIAARLAYFTVASYCVCASLYALFAKVASEAADDVPAIADMDVA
jgi:hypothetical protein